MRGYLYEITTNKSELGLAELEKYSLSVMESDPDAIFWVEEIRNLPGNQLKEPMILNMAAVYGLEIEPVMENGEVVYYKSVITEESKEKYFSRKLMTLKETVQKIDAAAFSNNSVAEILSDMVINRNGNCVIDLEIDPKDMIPMDTWFRLAEPETEIYIGRCGIIH